MGRYVQRIVYFITTYMYTVYKLYIISAVQLRNARNTYKARARTRNDPTYASLRYCLHMILIMSSSWPPFQKLTPEP